MPNTSVNEPTVSVHGVPKSQYDQSGGVPVGGGAPGDGAGGWLKQHWIITTVGIGLLVLALWAWYNNHNSAATAATGSGTGNSSPDQLYGAQLDADYQQMSQQMTLNNSLLQQLYNKINTPGTTVTSPAPAPPTSTTPGGPTGGTSPGKWKMITTTPGQTLEGIALANGFHDVQGSAAWQQLYNSGPGGPQGGGNAYIISTAAKEHGVTQHFQNFVYPGEKLYVPA